ncbi:MAG: hypothetical protein QOE63_1280, partial [Acidimicrobiaceae bacterium]
MRSSSCLQRALAAIVSVALLGAVLGATSAKASSSSTYGDTTGYALGGGFVWQSSADLNADLDAVVSSGGSWIRMDLPWSAVESTQGTYRWTTFDNAINAAAARGLHVLALLAYAPTWATGCAGTDKCLPTAASMPAWGAFAGAAAARYRG